MTCGDQIYLLSFQTFKWVKSVSGQILGRKHCLKTYLCGSNNYKVVQTNFGKGVDFHHTPKIGFHIWLLYNYRQKLNIFTVQWVAWPSDPTSKIGIPGVLTPKLLYSVSAKILPENANTIKPALYVYYTHKPLLQFLTNFIQSFYSRTL